MKRILSLSIAAVLLVAPALNAQSGPDVIVGDLPSMANHGSSGGISAYSVGTTSCNIGTSVLLWQANNNNHPVIAQHIYRYHNGRYEQIGQSFLKHGFTALSGTLCGPCGLPNGSQLSPGCSDPYGASLNGSQSGLGPKCEVNATTGIFPYPFSSPSGSGNIFKRIQVHNSDLNSTNFPGASYYVEGHYIANDDAAAGNDDNNASYRKLNVGGSSNNPSLSTTGATHQQKPAIMAWPEQHDADVVVNNVDIPGDGRVIVALKITALGGGQYNYEIAIQNLNSHRSIASVNLELENGATASNIGFHDVDYHSRDGNALVNGSSNGLAYDGTDWPGIQGGNNVVWQTSTESLDPNANAIRWGTLYNFRCDSDTAPGSFVNVTLGMYRSGSPATVTTSLSLAGASTMAKIAGDNQVTSLGSPFASPFTVEVTSVIGGSPVVGAPVSFSATGVTLTSASTVNTDAQGRASVTASGNSVLPGAGTITATIGNNSVAFSCYTRGLRVISNGGTGILIVIASEPSYGSSTVPLLMYAGPTGQLPYSTFIGDLCMNPTDPTSGIVFLDGFGVFGGVSYQGKPTAGTPSLTNVYTGVFGLTGTNLSFQAIGYNAALGGWFVSNCVDHTFN